MGYAFERTTASGAVRYTAVYRDLKGRLRSAGTFETRRRAEEAALFAERDAAEGRMPDRRRGRQTLRRYVTQEWFPNHMVEATTRESYGYLINKYILPELGDMRLIELLPADVRTWIGRLQAEYQLNPPTIRQCKTILDAALTTALNDRIVYLHAGKGVKTPPVVRKTKRIITVQQFEAIYAAIDDPTMRLLVETDIETGLRWGELTELRPQDIDLRTGVITVSRTVVYLRAKDRPEGAEFVVKDYPKDREWRRLRLPPHMLAKTREHIRRRGLGSADLLFPMPDDDEPRRRRRPAVLPDPESLGSTEPNHQGLTYLHGTTSAYAAGSCRCVHCRDAMAAYRAERRSRGLDQPRKRRTAKTDGHIGNDYFRRNVWAKAVAKAGIDFHVTPHGLRHAHASWLLAGGADLQVVKERLGHGSITTTEQYLHSLPGAHDAAIQAMNAVRGGLRSSGGYPESPDGTPTWVPGALVEGAGAAELVQLRSAVAQLTAMLTTIESRGNVAG